MTCLKRLIEYVKFWFKIQLDHVMVYIAYNVISVVICLSSVKPFAVHIQYPLYLISDDFCRSPSPSQTVAGTVPGWGVQLAERHLGHHVRCGRADSLPRGLHKRRQRPEWVHSHQNGRWWLIFDCGRRQHLLTFTHRMTYFKCRPLCPHLRHGTTLKYKVGHPLR